MENITILTHDQEKQILEYVLSLPMEDAGAARAVFMCSIEEGKQFGLKLPFDCVIKVSMGLGGYNQTQLEIRTFLEFGDKMPLARIVAYGRYIEIMERVSIEHDWRELDDYCDADEFYQYNDESYDFDEVDEAYSVFNELNDFFGYTSDNGQLGRTENGDLVAYDYGFTTDKLCRDQTSDISDSIYKEEDRRTYIEGLIELLDEQEDYLELWEKRFLHNENGDDTYTRFNARRLVRNRTDMRMWLPEYSLNDSTFEDYNKALQRIQEEEGVLAYVIEKNTYNLDNEVVNTEILDECIDEKYKDLWENLDNRN